MTADSHAIAVKIRDAMAYRYPAMAAFEAPVVIAAIKEVLDQHEAERDHSKEFSAAWNSWLAYRAERKLKPYTKIGGNAQLARLIAWGERRAIDAIQYSMAQGYQGIFEEQGRAPAEGGGKMSEWELKQKAERIREYKIRLRELTNPGGSAWSVELTGKRKELADELRNRIQQLQGEME